MAAGGNLPLEFYIIRFKIVATFLFLQRTKEHSDLKGGVYEVDSLEPLKG